MCAGAFTWVHAVHETEIETEATGRAVALAQVSAHGWLTAAVSASGWLGARGATQVRPYLSVLVI